jgi:hypothetical protein
MLLLELPSLLLLELPERARRRCGFTAKAAM